MTTVRHVPVSDAILTEIKSAIVADLAAVGFTGVRFTSSVSGYNTPILKIFGRHINVAINVAIMQRNQALYDYVFRAGELTREPQISMFGARTTINQLTSMYSSAHRDSVVYRSPTHVQDARRVRRKEMEQAMRKESDTIRNMYNNILSGIRRVETQREAFRNKYGIDVPSTATTTITIPVISEHV
jgi:hypothetical protein